MSQNTAHHISRFLLRNRRNPHLGYSASDFWSDVDSFIPKKTKRRARKKINKTVDSLVRSGTDKALSVVDSGIDYKKPTKQQITSLVASDEAVLSEEEIAAQKAEDEKKAREKEEASKKNARKIALYTLGGIGGLTALYFFMRD